MFTPVLVKLPAEYRRAAFYLAAEEYIARTLPAGYYLFTWQLRKTVVMGRNQVARAEVDIPYCRREGIDVIRRRSGGGAIFADEGNIMLSLVAPEGPVEPLFAAYAEMVAQALRQMGAPAEVSGRNDISLTGGGKICGNAFYHLTHRNIVHGTMLYDTASELMQRALHPAPEKLTEKGVSSVRRRVSLLKDHLPFGVDELRRRLETTLTSGVLTLTDLAPIEQIEQTYYDPRHTRFGDDPELQPRRIAGVGSLAIGLTLDGGIIKDVRLAGDYFELADAHAAFLEALRGATVRDIPARLALHHPEQSIRGLTLDAALDIYQ